MASLNDNLFTILVNNLNTSEFAGVLHTRWGRLKIIIRSNGIEAMNFEMDIDSKHDDYDSAFQRAFLIWLRTFEDMSPTKQWNYLAPLGTDFQRLIWRTLLEIPIGQQCSYQQIANRVGQPGASRAVGSAIAANSIALLIPCHRVVLSTGSQGNYRWGANRKRALIETEQLRNITLHQLFE